MFILNNLNIRIMRKILYTLLFVLPLGFAGCTLHPEARFFPDSYEVYIGEEVWFTNESYNAVEYEWDFGDGTWTDVENPIHSFSASGSYEVVLTAFSRKDLRDEYSVTISVITPTILEIEVLEWDQEYPVPNANVRLYSTLNDWDDETNMVIEGNTNINGKVVFYDLGQFIYYADVWETNHNNWDLRGYQNDEYLRTQQLVANEINYFIAWVDYVPAKKGTNSERGDRTMVIRKLERVPKK
jgi:PKD repeat protein